MMNPERGDDREETDIPSQNCCEVCKDYGTCWVVISKVENIIQSGIHLRRDWNMFFI